MTHWRLGFAGTPDFAATVLEALIASRHEIALVYTQPDRPSGRGRREAPSPVRALAEAHDLAVRTPTRLRREAEHIAELDGLVVAAYGLILPESLLDVPKLGCINVHASLLPRWRGAAPIEHAIMAGDTRTGVSIMHLEPSLDTGPVYARAETDIHAEDTGATVAERLARLGAKTLLEVLDALPAVQPVPQDDALATYAPKLTSEMARIDWREDAACIERRVRALSGRVTAFATLGDLRLRVLSATASCLQGHGDIAPGTLLRGDDGWCVATGDGALVLGTVQLNRGKGKPLPMKDLVNGYQGVFAPGVQFDVG